MSQSASRALTQWRVLRSEWIKIVTLRSTWITIAAIVAVIIGFGLLSALLSAGAFIRWAVGRGAWPHTCVYVYGCVYVCVRMRVG